MPKNILKAAWCQLEDIWQIKSVTQYNADFTTTIIEVINLSNTEALSLYMRGLKTQTYDYVSLEDPDKLYDAMKIAEKFDVIKFGLKTKDSKSRNKDSWWFNNWQNNNSYKDKEFNTMNRKKIDLERYKQEGQCFRCHEKGYIGVNCPKYPRPISKPSFDRQGNDKRQ